MLLSNKHYTKTSEGSQLIWVETQISEAKYSSEYNMICTKQSVMKAEPSNILEHNLLERTHWSLNTCTFRLLTINK